MNSKQLSTWMFAGVALVLGLVYLGVPFTTVLIGLFVLACPLVMIVMMRSGHGGHGSDRRGGDVDEHRHGDRPSSGGR